MPLIKFNYHVKAYITPKTNKVHYLYTPVVSLQVINKLNQKGAHVNCLVDSGSDKNLLPAIIGETLGIDIHRGIPVKHIGVKDITVKAFRHRVIIIIESYQFETDIDFSYEDNVSIVGRNGFFNRFKKILFNEEEEFVQLEY